MALLTKVGSFATPAGGAIGQQIVPGVGFQPKALILWTAGAQTGSGVWDSHIRVSLGFSTGPTNSYAVGIASQDALAASDTARRMAAKVYTKPLYDGVSVFAEADLQSFDADGFTLNWTTNGQATHEVMYLALGGSDITGAKVINWNVPAAVGAAPAIGVGFKPDLVLHAMDAMTTFPNNLGTGHLSFGVMNKHGQQWTNAVAMQDGVNPSNTWRYQQTDSCIALPGSVDGAVAYQCHFQSMDADGFTLYSTSAVDYNNISLCIKGVSSKIGAFAKTTAAAPASQSIERVGFQPKAVLFSTVTNVSAGAPAVSCNYALGVDDGVGRRAVAFTDQDAVSPTNSKSMWDNAHSILNPYVAPDTNSTATATMNADGFTLNWDKNGASPQEHLYLALGDAGVDTFPSMVV